MALSLPLPSSLLKVPINFRSTQCSDTCDCDGALNVLCYNNIIALADVARSQVFVDLKRCCSPVCLVSFMYINVRSQEGLKRQRL